ncbi:heavy metal-associated isoprenylated plant protein 3 [Canna indica]|uniref:Heavy metal-associated isoprenylated plant protein 3 n=1 Tax=Canna indica TaxID=4628 RepID=A0AAQ3KGF5_9LILI|nr:heavy metal-associated isoprenylated plant protein 3 [Canna indica]
MGEEAKQEVEAKQEEKKEEKKEEKSEEKKEEKAEEKKEEVKPGPPPPIVLAVDLHCVGCAKKIEKSILKCRGVESVEVDMMQNQVTVKGIVDPQVLCSRIQKRTMRNVKVLSPLPPAEGDPKPEDVPPPVSGITTVELLVNMHCEACAEQLKRKILKMRGVQTAETDMSAGKVTVTGTMNGEKIVEYIHRRTGKIASIIPPPPPPKEEEKKEEEKKGEEKPAEEKKEEKKEESTEKKEEEKAAEPQDGDGKEEKGGGAEEKKEGDGEAINAVTFAEEDMMKKMIYWNNPNFIGEEEMARRMMHWMPVYVIQRPPPPPPQLFSDENPNACCIT